MRKSNSHTKKEKSKIQCLEVLIPKSFIVNSVHNLHWTLSVYSLENHPVKKHPSIHHSEVFHFMVYDWKRTIKPLLEELKIPHSIIQYFTPETIYIDALKDDLCFTDHSADLLSAMKSVPVPGEEIRKVAHDIFSSRATDKASLILAEKTN